MIDLIALLGPVSTIAVDAGAAILEIYNRGDVDVDHKADNSPITEADRAAHNLMRLFAGRSRADRGPPPRPKQQKQKSPTPPRE